MILVKNIKILEEYVSSNHAKSLKTGFVPTMGALHAGHISLVETSKQENDFTYCSIFVNPTQFNNAADLQHYPVTIETDIDMLEKAGCDLLFLPAAVDMYPPGEKPEHYDLGYLETILEGEFRPGHFQGVCMIVDKLLRLVRPGTIYLGRKDYQQCMVIARMIKEKHLHVKLWICDTLREPGGLAMSSRNMRLTPAQKEQAFAIIECLLNMQKNIRPGNLSALKKEAVYFLHNKGFKPDYVEIADAETLQLLNDWNGSRKLVALAAAYLGDVRLIDNIIL
jgi:pantoate--beta-alanine ligase